MTLIVEDGSIQDKRYRSTYDTLHWKCRACNGSNYKQYSDRRTCLDCVKTRQQKYKANGQSKNTDLKRMYGITIDQYNTLLAKQKGVCKICSKVDPKFRLSVNHCHNTNKIRGLLCGSCNIGLGKFKDNIDSLNAAINYLESTRCL